MVKDQQYDEVSVVEISPHAILPQTTGGFSVMLRHQDRLLLYCRRGEQFTPAHRDRLAAMGIHRLYIHAHEKKFYEEYLHRNLPKMLDDDGIPVDDRALLWGQSAAGLVKDIYQERLSRSLAGKRFARVEHMVQSSTDFIRNPDALKNIASYVSRGYSEYHHSLGVMVLALSLAQTYEHFDDETLTGLGLGAIFHDIGKIRLPQFIFAKKPSERTPQEMAMACSHPTLGVVVAGSLPLHQLTIQCILFHHEMENGQGYPSGICGADIPLPVKILSLCNVYENLTRATAEGPAKTPFEALSWLKERRDRFDVDVIRRLIMVLSKADLA